MKEKKKTVITYGTYDLLHIGHIKMLKRLSTLGDRLIVGVSTDEFNEGKGKKSLYSFEDRFEIVSSLKYVDLVIPEKTWDQKISDVEKYDVNVFGIGDDWQGKFDFLEKYCDVVYLPRTPGVSSTQLRALTGALDESHLKGLKNALEILGSVVKQLS